MDRFSVEAIGHSFPRSRQRFEFLFVQLPGQRRGGPAPHQESAAGRCGNGQAGSGASDGLCELA